MPLDHAVGAFPAEAPPPRAERRRGDDTRGRLLDAVEGLIAEQGFKPLTHRTIASRAEALKAADRRHMNVYVDQVAYDGTVHVQGELDLANALDLDEALGEGAARLAALGCPDPIDARRARAMGELARGAHPTLPLGDGGADVPAEREARTVGREVSTSTSRKPPYAAPMSRRPRTATWRAYCSSYPSAGSARKPRMRIIRNQAQPLHHQRRHNHAEGQKDDPVSLRKHDPTRDREGQGERRC